MLNIRHSFKWLTLYSETEPIKIVKRIRTTIDNNIDRAEWVSFPVQYIKLVYIRSDSKEIEYKLIKKHGKEIIYVIKIVVN